jgi:AraC-like DNA-binding protein
MTRSAEVRRMLSESRFRSVRDPMERARMLQEEYGVSEGDIASKFGYSRSKVTRGLKALRAGRVPGLTGRPRYMSVSWRGNS